MDARQFRTWRGRLGKQNFKDALVFLLFLVFSTLFWMVFTLSEVHESTVQVELKLTNVPRSVVITEPLPSTVQVQIQDRGMTLMHYLMRGIKPVLISFSDVSDEKEGCVQVSVAEVQRLLRNNLLESSKVTKISPDNLEYWYNRGESKIVPLKLGGQVTPGNGHLVTGVEVSPRHVVVVAPRHILDTLTAVYTMPTTLANLQAGRSENVKLRPIRGAKFNTEIAEVEADVDILVEESVKVAVGIDSLPEGRSLRLFPTSDIKVVYSCGYTQSKNIKPEDFGIRLSYDRVLDLQRKGIGKIPLRLTTMPSTALNVHLEPSEVEYMIDSTAEQEE